jgi:hypothetical protein
MVLLNLFCFVLNIIEVPLGSFDALLDFKIQHVRKSRLLSFHESLNLAIIVHI